MKCLHQIFRPPLSVKPRGWGDCQRCVESSENKKCKGYQPADIRIRTFIVKPKKRS